MDVAAQVVGGAESVFGTHPELVAALIVGTVALVGGLYVVLRFKRPMGTRFLERLSELDEVAVLMHPNPDPDAMAAAIGVACLAEQVGTDSYIQYSGQIRHQENRAFETVLDLDLDAIDHVTDLAAEHVVLVDHNQPRGFAGADGILPFAIVDHHPGEGTGERFTDVRTDYGACASIVAEYFRDIGAKPVPPDRHASEVGSEYTVPSTIATGLLYGILTDTKRLTAGCSEADFTAAGYLYPGVNEDILDRIANPEVSKEVLELKARAIAGRDVRGPFAVSDIGTLSNVDAIPQAADELIQLEGVTAVVVCGERDGTLYLSGRSRDDRVHMGRTLGHALDNVPGASAGGHARMGGGQIPQREGGIVTDGGDALTRDTLCERLFEAMSGDV
ncbi:bifunctional oligoribonuclease/PAP phosphatase NrnA [Halogeometricum borinquense]|uniref:Bifunctional oligoribonuclease/PAP phosphatase NrnA n=1 Tax=Halogeometricum borinquense TaxID=60847 RepID=A0A6C0UPR6_9EURY|nr:bifunctional oligoribonuclease/PAP phosphatase NrnA [Halogeometricum borinquense]QIQ77781.1 bifunctional oligoribonuclease/PAP phosphatase NrnA [Halogeometricum borinquense]